MGFCQLLRGNLSPSLPPPLLFFCSPFPFACISTKSCSTLFCLIYPLFVSIFSLSLSTSHFFAGTKDFSHLVYCPKITDKQSLWCTATKNTTHISPLLNLDLLSQCIYMYKCNIIHVYTWIDLCVYVKQLSAYARAVSLP